MTFLKKFGQMHKFRSLGLEFQVSSLGVFDEVSVSKFNQVSVSATSLVVGVRTVELGRVYYIAVVRRFDNNLRLG